MVGILSLGKTDVAEAHAGHPLGVKAIAWHPDPVIGRTLALNYDAHAGRFIIARRNVGSLVKVEGRDCLTGPYFLFDIRDEFAFDEDATAKLELLFRNTGATGAYVTYDHVIEPDGREVRFDQASREPWHRVTVELDRARFANRKYGGTDFGIAAAGAAGAGTPGRDHQVTLCDLKLTLDRSARSPESGELVLSLADDAGKAVTARVGIYDEEGRAPLPGKSAMIIDRYSDRVRHLSLLGSKGTWPGKGSYVFYVDGHHRQKLPAGRYQLVVGKGPEFHYVNREITIAEGETLAVTLRPQRWSDLPAAGWYSGDGHIHIARESREKNQGIAALMAAEDIHVANLLQMGNLRRWYYPQYAFGEAGVFQSGSYLLASGQEAPRSAHLGHTIGLNASSFHWDENRQFIYSDVAEALRREGGVFGYAHVALADSFELQRGLPLGVALGYVDFLEILQMGVLNTRLYYDFLNLGFRLLPSAGSDYPYIDVAGSDRLYVKLTKPFSRENWFSAWTSGRSFVSNAPVIEFSVNGDEAGSELSLERGATIAISATARVNPARDSLTELELVVHGDVVASERSAEGKEALHLQHSLKLDRSLWFAIRTVGKHGTIAHTSAYYVTVDGTQRTWKQESVEDIAARFIQELKALGESSPDVHADFESFDTADVMARQWDNAKPILKEQTERAIQTFQALARESRAR
ncbi:CehA/McbA family metallohydrolase [Pseudohaliea rubra]|nr:CehA/McbA family metallohydrolase [Pseudohaliea rubra]